MSKYLSYITRERVIKSQSLRDQKMKKHLISSRLRSDSGLITLRQGFKNTGSTESAITFLDGEKGILRLEDMQLKI